MFETFTYNTSGTVATHTDYNGQTTTFTYDIDGRQTSITYADGHQTSFTYTASGKRATVTDAHGTTTYTYDIVDRVIRVVSPEGTIGYTYDSAGHRAGLTTAAGTTSYAYDKRGYLTSVTGPDGGVTTYAYNSTGELTRSSLPNGVVTKYTYDAKNQLIGVENDGPSGVVLSGFAYTISAAGYRQSEVDSNGRSVAYSYDVDHHLIEEKVIDPTLGNSDTRYTYDASGNRLTEIGANGTITYTYDANGRLISDGATTYAYDANGSMIGRTTGSQATTYIYNAQDQLVQVKNSNDISTYGYDSAGTRTSETINGIGTTYLVDETAPNSQVLAELDPAGHVVASYVIGQALISEDRGGAISYYLYDGRATTRQLTNQDGTVTDSYAYDAFGNVLGHTGPTTNLFLYPATQLDPFTGLYYLKAATTTPPRVDSPRWIPSVVASSLPGTLNQYSYAQQDPVNMIDPSGHFGIFLAGAIFSAEFALQSVVTALLPLIHSLVNFSLVSKGVGKKDPALVAGLDAGFSVGSLATFGYGGSIEGFTSKSPVTFTFILHPGRASG